MGNQLSLVNETNQTCKTYLHNLFTDVYSTLNTGDVSIMVYCSLFSAYNMSESGTRSGSFLEDDRPLFNNGFVDTKGWVDGLRDYITAMKDRFPAEHHPSEDWLK